MVRRGAREREHEAVWWLAQCLFIVAGGELAAFGMGVTNLAKALGIALCVVTTNLLPWTLWYSSTLLITAERRHPARKQRLIIVPARVESARAEGEGPEVPLKLDLTVAPPGQSAYRTHTRARVNIMDAARFQAGHTVMVEHDPLQPWQVIIHSTRPSMPARIESAPEHSRPPKPLLPISGRNFCAAASSMLAGVATVVSALLLGT